MHALHGNGVCSHCGTYIDPAVIFSDANLEVIDNNLHGSHQTVCHGCQASNAYADFMIYQEGHFYFVEKWG